MDEELDPLPSEPEPPHRVLGWIALVAILASWVFGPMAVDWIESTEPPPWLQHLIAIGVILFLVPFHVLIVIGVYEAHRRKGPDRAFTWTCGTVAAVALILYWLS